MCLRLWCLELNCDSSMLCIMDKCGLRAPACKESSTGDEVKVPLAISSINKIDAK